MENGNQSAIPISRPESPKPQESPSPGYKRFVEATSPSKEQQSVTTLLRCHLLTEYYIDELLTAALSRGDILVDEENRLGFAEKLLIVESLDILSQGLITSMRKLNKVRNDCSHARDYKIMETDIDKIGYPLGHEYIIEKQKASNSEQLLVDTLMILIASLDGRIDRYIDSVKKKP